MFDPVTVTAGELQTLLQDGELTSVDVIDVYLKQIEKHNHNGLKLNGLISVAPREILLRTAARLDQERRNGDARSLLHGIPIVVKDSIVTDAKLGMPTTNGSYAYKGARATCNAKCIELLVQAGMIILGKANLTEASGMKSPSMTPGWSVAGGQTQTPYVFPSNREGDKILGNSRPGGSSSGSAVAVAAGFAPLSLGTEAVGSLVTPANRAALYGLKLPPGVSPNEGVFGISNTFDGVGGMAKSADDLAALTALLMAQPELLRDPAENRLSVGFVDPREWHLPEVICSPDELDTKQMIDDYEAAVRKVEMSGVNVRYPVIVPDADILKPTKDDPYRAIAFHQCQPIFEETVAIFDECSIKTLADLVRWNKENSDIAMPKDACPDQKDLEDTVAFKSDPVVSKELHGGFRRLGGLEGLDPVFEEHNLDIIAGPADSRFVSFAAAAGYPVGCLPMAHLKESGRPFGICVIARNGGEQTLLRFMQQWEKMMPSRVLPKPLVDWKKS